MDLGILREYFRRTPVLLDGQVVGVGQVVGLRFVISKYEHQA